MEGVDLEGEFVSRGYVYRRGTISGRDTIIFFNLTLPVWGVKL